MQEGTNRLVMCHQTLRAGTVGFYRRLRLHQLEASSVPLHRLAHCRGLLAEGSPVIGKGQSYLLLCVCVCMCVCVCVRARACVRVCVCA